MHSPAMGVSAVYVDRDVSDEEPHWEIWEDDTLDVLLSFPADLPFTNGSQVLDAFKDAKRGDSQIPIDALLLYHRQGDLLRFKTEGMTNHELREVMVGIWARLDYADRVDHIRELLTYNADTKGWLSQVASALSRGVAGENAVNLADVAKVLTSDLP